MQMDLSQTGGKTKIAFRRPIILDAQLKEKAEIIYNLLYEICCTYVNLRILMIHVFYKIKICKCFFLQVSPEQETKWSQVTYLIWGYIPRLIWACLYCSEQKWLNTRV